jgi:hypothetical protein
MRKGKICHPVREYRGRSEQTEPEQEMRFYRPGVAKQLHQPLFLGTGEEE